MSGINPGVMFAVNRICVSFKDDLGDCKIISGTGFWIFNNQLILRSEGCRLKLSEHIIGRLNGIDVKFRAQSKMV